MRILRFLVALGLLASFGPLAWPAYADDAQRAKDLFTEGTRYFDLGQFDKAIDAWQAGYREKPDAVFLYNIAQAYRLGGDLSKAIFFYKGFLRNSPKAHNRTEVEQRIAGLQKQLAEQEAAKAARPPSAPAPNREPPSAPSPASAPPPPAASLPSAPSASMTAGTTTVDAAAGPAGPPSPAPPDVAGPPLIAAAADEVVRPLDLAVAIGADGWSSGVQAKTNASFAFMLAAGYAPGHDPTARVRFRIGASFGYTFLKEAMSRETFLSLLVVPTLLIRANARIGFFGELGVGVLGVSGLQPSSALLDHTLMLKISGTQSLLEIRPALGFQVQLTPGLGIFATTAIDYSPKGTHFYQAINRPELLIGLSLRR